MGVQQTELPLSNAADYCFTWYVAYLFYIPLFIFGPVLSYNAFVAQMKSSQITYSWAQIERYGLQIVGSILVMEVFLGKVWYPPLMNSATSDELLNSFGSWELLCGVHCRLVYSWATLFIIGARAVSSHSCMESIHQRTWLPLPCLSLP